MKISTILLPVDGSVHSDNAADYAAELGKSLGATIILLYVRRSIPPELGEPNSSELLNVLVKEAEEVIELYQKRLDAAGVDFKDAIVGGNVAEAIVDAADAEEADLVVMGSKGKSDLEGLIMGSITHKVLHTSKVPVLVVR